MSNMEIYLEDWHINERGEQIVTMHVGGRSFTFFNFPGKHESINTLSKHAMEMYSLLND